MDSLQKSALLTDSIGTQSFYFSAKVPEGNYKVTARLGNSSLKSITTIKAESRRLMIEKCTTDTGEFITVTFTVNVRTPQINDSTSIILKPREHKYLNWDNKLTLEFAGFNPHVCSIEIEEYTPNKTIYLAGNSTVTDQNDEPWASWGQMITRFFKPEISIANYAESGESLHDFYHENRLEKVLSLIQPGDYFFIEFGHNDMKRKGEGIGPWTSYSDYLRMYIEKSRSKGAIPVLVTPMQRRSFNDSGIIENTFGDYPDAKRAVAKELNVPLIDLNRMSKQMYETWGDEESKKAFCQYPSFSFPGQESDLKDNTHFNNFGAYNIALCIIYGINELNLELKDYLINVPTDFSPETPLYFEKWDFPYSAMASNKKPAGS